MNKTSDNNVTLLNAFLFQFEIIITDRMANKVRSVLINTHNMARMRGQKHIVAFMVCA